MTALPITALLCLVGPTASGKSSLALELGARLGGEIVSCDSMQIYRGCDIVTAKPSPAERAALPHHLLDLCDPGERFSAAQWAQQARRAIDVITQRGQTAIVCGGTGFWLRALLCPEKLSDVAPDAALKASLEAQLQAEGGAKMHTRLASLDPAAAQRLHPNDTFRVVRALEIALLRPDSNPQSAPPEPESSLKARIFGLDMPRAQLYERIEARVDAMIEAGAVQELHKLREKWGDAAPALGGVGYKQLLPVLRGETDWESGIDAWKRDSRRYAKRQMTWLRHQLPVEWLDATRPVSDLADEIATIAGLS